MCGEKLDNDSCSNCGYESKSVNNVRKDVIDNLNENKSNNAVKKVNNNNRNKGIIIGLIVIIIAAILIGSFVLGANNSEKILRVGDLELNMTGYNYNLESNVSANSVGVSGFVETYSVSGKDDSFTLTVMVLDDTYGFGDVGDLGTSFSGDLNAVAVTKYINGKYYWIQISYANDAHNTVAYLESIIITKGSDVPDVVNESVDTSSTVSSSSSSSSNDDEYYTGPSGDGSIITTRNGPTEGGGYNYHGVHYDDSGVADGPAY